MIPINQISIGDIFQNPMFKNGLLFVVEDINKPEKMIKVQPHDFEKCQPFGPPMWKSNKDRMFRESWSYYKNEIS